MSVSQSIEMLAGVSQSVEMILVSQSVSRDNSVSQSVEMLAVSQSLEIIAVSQ